MRKRAFLMSICLTLSSLCCVYAQEKRYGIALDESFEEGIPPGWTQEFVSGEQKWVVESGDLTLPDGAAAGDKRVALRNTAGHTLGYVSMLVTPVMNLDTILDPILTFAYASDKWTGDFDTLKIYYRTSQSIDWILYQNNVYDRYSSRWQRDTIQLTAPSSTYQIAFCGSDNMGRGIVLDDIQVRSAPNCRSPFNIETTELSNDSVVLIWNALFDALKFHVKVSSVALSPEELESSKTDVLDSVQDAQMGRHMAVKGLSPGHKYYVYIRTVCGNEESVWSDFSFTTSNVMEIPYYEGFNLGYVQGYNLQLETWSHITSTGYTIPFVNTNTQDLYLDDYSYNRSRVLAFCGEDIKNPLAEHEYAYAIMPEVESGVAVAQLRMSLWVGNRCGDRIIVGVMTDRQDKETFTPIDTLAVTDKNGFQEFYVSFEEYDKGGRFIALLSDFDKENRVFIDDIRIYTEPECAKARDIRTGYTSATEMTLSWSSDGATEGEMIITDDKIDDFEAIDETTVLKRADLSSNPAIVNIKPWTEGWMYVRNRCGGSAGRWSNPVFVRTPDVWLTLPDTMTFESDEHSYSPSGDDYYKMSKGVLVYGEPSAYPYCYEGYWGWRNERTKYVLRFDGQEPGETVYTVFPEVERLSSCRVTFWAQTLYAPTEFTVGVMSDANDTSTFEPVETVVITDEAWRPYAIQFDGYTNGGKYITIKTDERNKGLYLDDVAVDKIPACKVPGEIKAEARQNDVTFTWPDESMAQWHVRVWQGDLEYDSLYSITYNKWFKDTVVDRPMVKIDGLKPDREEYHYSIATVCGDEMSEWLFPEMFRTECSSTFPVPYTMDFEGYNTEADLPEFAVPCMYTVPSKAGYFYYPNLGGSGESWGSTSLYLSQGVNVDGIRYTSYLALPLLEESMDELQLTLTVNGQNQGAAFAIGLMSDPYDTLTFEGIDTVICQVKDRWEEITVALSGDRSKHIAIKTVSDGTFYVDDLTADYKDKCGKVSYPEVVSVSDTEAVVRWKAGSEQMWDMVVTDAEVSGELLDMIISGESKEHLVQICEVKDKPIYTIEGVDVNTTYWFYIRANCGNGLAGEWIMYPGTFHTLCAAVPVGEASLQTFEGNGIGCWILGNADGKSKKPTADENWAVSGTRSLKFCNMPDEGGVYAIAPVIDVDSIKHAEVTFYGTASDYGERLTVQGQLAVGILTNINDLSSFEKICTVDGYADGQEYRVSFDLYEGDYNGNIGKYVAFMSQDFAKDNCFYIDDVRFDKIPECPVPVDMAAENITSDGATVTWRRGNAPYEVKWSTRQLTGEELDGSDIVGKVSQQASVKIDGLEAATTYYMYARGSCEAGMSGWSSVYRFKTECQAGRTVPYFENFERYSVTGEGANPDCWICQYGYAQDASQSHRYPHLISDGVSKALYVYADMYQQSFAVMPALDGDMKEWTLSFDAALNSNNAAQRAIVVGVCRDVSCVDSIVESFVPIDTFIHTDKKPKRYFAILDRYAGMGKNIAFTTSKNINASDGGWYLDNISVDVTPSCLRPEYCEVTGFTHNTIDLKFYERGDAEAWEVKYYPQGHEDKVIIADARKEMVSLSGLIPATVYELHVRSVCGEEEYSEWNGPIICTTMAKPVDNFPYYNGFEPDSAVENGHWEMLGIEGTNTWHVGTAYPKDGSQSLYISGDGGLTADIGEAESHSWAYRIIKLEPGVYTFDFDWICYGATYAAYMRVGLMPAQCTFEAGSNIIECDGVSKALETDAIKTPARWIPLEGADASGNQLYKMNMVYDWVHNSVSHVITEETAGMYKLIVYWMNYSSGWYSKPMPSAVIDNLKIKHNECVYPQEIELTGVWNDSAILGWEEIVGAVKYEVALTPDMSIMSPDGVEGRDVTYVYSDENGCELSNLTGDTDYRVFVRSYCSDSECGEWSKYLSFRTACDPPEADRVTYGFEESEGLHDGYSSSYKVPDCFIQGHDTKPMGSGDHFPNVKENSYYNKVARTGERSLYLYHGGYDEQGGYIVFPLVDADLDTMQLRFWMRATSENSYGGMDSYSMGSNYANYVIVGTMDNPYDPQTFHKIATAKYPYDWEFMRDATPDNDPEDEVWWREVRVPLQGATGRYIAIKNDTNKFYYNKMYIDDVIVEPVGKCAVPYDLRCMDVTPNSSLLSFSHMNGDRWVIHISTDKNMSDTVRMDTVYGANDVPVDGLESNTLYYMAVRQICAEDLSSGWSEAIEVLTPAEIRYNEGFSEKQNVPAHWFVSYQSVQTVFAGVHLNASSSEWVEYQWNRYDSTGLHSPHQSMRITGEESSWLVSPAVSLPENSDVQLTFDLSLTMAGSDDAVHEIYHGSTDKMFMVAISDDGGDSWKPENAVVWCNDGYATYPKDRSFDDISPEGERVVIDLSAYARRTVKIGFYAESKSADYACDVHVDNVQVNRFVTKEEKHAICETEDCETGVMTIISDDLAVGDNDFDVTMPSSVSDEPDVNYNIRITVTPMMTTPIKGTVCEGVVYTDNGFSEDKPGVYKQKHQSANRCDSVVTLNLTVIPTRRSEVVDSMCRGGEYEWRGEVFERPGTYRDTLRSNVTQCDSIVTLVLLEIREVVTDLDMSICHGDTLWVGETAITEAGYHTVRLESHKRCDSVVNVNLSFEPEYGSQTDTVICKGERYADKIFTGIETDVYDEVVVKSVNGCDSTVRLNLVVIEDGVDKTVNIKIDEDELPFVFFDKTFGTDTKAGVYEEVFDLTNGRCSAKVHLVLQVGGETDIRDMSVSDELVLTPNPVRVHESVMVHLDLTDAERDGLVVNVYNNAGMLLQRFMPGGGAITIDGFSAAGVYMVRIADGQGNVYAGKIIVR